MSFAKLIGALLVVVSVAFTVTGCNEEGGNSHGHSHD